METHVFLTKQGTHISPLILIIIYHIKETNQMKQIHTANFQNSELDLHDSLLQDIEISYDRKNIIIFLIFPKSPPLRDSEKKAKLLIENISHFVISIEEPWGKGTYIVSEEIDRCTNDQLKLIITLNSGDTLEITGMKISLTDIV